MDYSELILWVTVTFPLLFLIFTTFILLRNALDFTTLPETSDASEADSTKTNPPLHISVCIPARNEEPNIEACLSSVINQQYPSYEVLALDDQSEDCTGEIIRTIAEANPNVRQLSGNDRPSGWLGKPWACRQLADHATGDILLFLDADCRLEPGTLDRVNTAFSTDQSDVITIWPKQILLTFWEHVVIPAIYYALLSLLPAAYVRRKPRWLPRLLDPKTRHWFAAACGQFLAFKKDVYHAIGTHEAVKNEVVEDMGLARKVKQAGYTLRMYNGADSISCRMYTSQNEMFEGFRKNFFAGFNHRTALFVFFGVIHAWVYLLPVAFFPVTLATGSPQLIMVLPALILIALHRLLLSMIFEWPLKYFWVQPLAVLWFLRLSITTLVDYHKSRQVYWKNRKISADPVDKD